MKKTITLVSIIVVLIVACIGGYYYYHSNAGFSPWMPRTEFNDWVFKQIKGGNLYVSAVEGRLAKGDKQWRARIVPVPRDMALDWHWYFDMSEKFYNDRVSEMTMKDKYDQIWTQSFLDKNGAKNYQAVFRKIALKQSKR
ncbi:MAG: hypothetical protein ABIP97_10215 [Chthoniobacterales bacterium]